MELHSWSADFGLPAWDQASLALQAYFKFTGAPVSVVASDSPLWSNGLSPVPFSAASSDLPAFYHRGERVDGGFERVVSHLETNCRFSTDVALTSRQRAEVTAFKKMVEERMQPATAFLCWVDPRNHAEVTRPWFARRLGFPTAFLHPPRYRARAEALVAAASRCDVHDDGPELVDRVVAASADVCLRALSQKLGDKPFLFGPSPSSLDALAFSHLAPLLKVPWPGAQALRRAALSYPNLESYVNRILTTHFAKECAAASASAGGKKSSNSKEEKKDENSDGSNSEEDRWATAENLVTVASAVALMSLYAYGTGLVHRVRYGLQQAYQH